MHISLKIISYCHTSIFAEVTSQNFIHSTEQLFFNLSEVKVMECSKAGGNTGLIQRARHAITNSTIYFGLEIVEDV